MHFSRRGGAGRSDGSFPTDCYESGMSVDAVLLLKVKDRAGLARALPDATGLRPLADDNATLFTGVRFSTDDDAMRRVIDQCFGGQAHAVLGDPRGVFVYADVISTRATTYDGILAEVGDGGRFIAATPLTEAERAADAAAAEAEIAGIMEAAEALRTGSPLPAAYAEQVEAMTRRQAAVLADYEAPLPTTPLDVGVAGASFSELAEQAQAFLAAAGGSALGTTGGQAASLDALEAQAKSFLETAGVTLPTDINPFACAAALIPPDMWKALESCMPASSITESVPLSGGGGLILSRQAGEGGPGLLTEDVAEALERAKYDRTPDDVLLTFRTTSLDGVAGGRTFEQLRDAMETQLNARPLRTGAETMATEDARAAVWLRGED